MLQGHLVVSEMEVAPTTATILEPVESAVATMDIAFNQINELAGVSLIIPTDVQYRLTAIVKMLVVLVNIFFFFRH